MHCLSPSTRLGQFAAVAALALTTLAPAWANPRLPEIQSSAPAGTAANLQTAVFAGGCTLDAVTAICAEPPGDEAEGLEM